MSRLGSTLARVKLKGIDGGPHKRWSMCFNSMQREEPYLVLTWECKSVEIWTLPQGTLHTGAAWLSSARVVRCWVKSRNERNPCPKLPSGNAGNSKETAWFNQEEGGDDVKSSWLLRPGLDTCYNGRYRGMPNREMELIPQNRSQFGLESAIRLHEAGIASNRGSARRGEYVPGPCTHRPSSHERWEYPKSFI